jgi:aminobenzoyl-glutamate utilization protein A
VIPEWSIDLNDVVALRRRLHANPELGFLEFRTARLIALGLMHLGFDVSLGADVMDTGHLMGVPDNVDQAWQEALAEDTDLALIDRTRADVPVMERMRGGLTGVVGTLRGSAPGRVAALRADMDALPIRESSDADHRPRADGFASRRSGVMHACGHDGHVAMLLAVAARFARTHFDGTLKLIFQPAEEGLRGARAMAEAGVVDDVDDLVCVHLGIGLPTGHASLSIDGSLASTKLRAVFTGVGAHAGLAPERGRSALLAGAAAALAVHALSQHGSADTRVNVGAFDAPGASNVIPAQATLRLEVRASNSSAAANLTGRVIDALKGSAAAYGVECAVDVVGSAPAVVCSQGLVQRLLALTDRPGLPELTSGWPDTGSDDAAWLIDRVARHGGTGTYLVVGANIQGGHHESAFDIDEAALPAGVDLIAHIVHLLGAPR